MRENDVVIKMSSKEEVSATFKITRPINKPLVNLKLKVHPHLKNKKAIIKKDYNINKLNEAGITVITSTNKPHCIENIFQNFLRQIHPVKELIIVINNNQIDIDEWGKKAKEYKNIRVYRLDESVSWGECLNFCVKNAIFDYIAHFDDDDYYSPYYLMDTLMSATQVEADLYGKGSHYIYFIDENLMALRTPQCENTYSGFVNGSTFFYHKRLLDKVRFRPINLGADLKMCHDCLRKGLKIYSINRKHHVYIRRSPKEHTWKISNSRLKSWSKIIGNIDDYRNYCLN